MKASSAHCFIHFRKNGFKCSTRAANKHLSFTTSGYCVQKLHIKTSKFSEMMAHLLLIIIITVIIIIRRRTKTQNLSVFLS